MFKKRMFRNECGDRNNGRGTVGSELHWRTCMKVVNIRKHR